MLENSVVSDSDLYAAMTQELAALRQRVASLETALAARKPTGSTERIEQERTEQESVEQTALAPSSTATQTYFEAFFAAATVGFVLLDEQLRYVYVNAALAKMNGCSIADHIGQAFGNLAPTIAPLLEPLFHQVLTTGEPVLNFAFTTPALSALEATQHWQASYYPLWGQNGECLGIGGIVVDVTEHNVESAPNSDRPRPAIALPESEQYNHQLFEQFPLGLTLCRMDGTLVEVNHTLAKLLGRTVEETLCLTYWDITPKKYATQEATALASLAQTGRYGPYEKEYIHKDGHLVPVRLTGLLIERRGEPFIWSSVEDITEQKLTEKALRQSETWSKHQAKELKQALQELRITQAQLVQTEKMSSLGQLVAGIAHEINNPVNFIHGNLSPAWDYTQDILRLLELYQAQLPNPTPEIRMLVEAIDLEFVRHDLPKLLASMRMGTDRIREIVLSLRNFSRLDEAAMKRVDLHEGIDSTLVILGNRLKAKSACPAIKVIKQYSEVPLLDCYAGQLNQVFMNILSNAIDAIETLNEERLADRLTAHSGEITISTTATDAPGNALRWATIRIADNGPGMSETIRQKLFDPFFTTKPIGKGTGMGMAISYQIVTERHNGRLQCLSSSGKGAEFVIELPIQMDDEPS